MIDRRHLIGATAALAALGAPRAGAQAAPALSFFIPAAPGGGWDGTGRAMERALRAGAMVRSVQFEHAPGAGGAVGLPRFLAQRRGNGEAIMVAGMVMVGALIANRSPVRLLDATPIARLTGEALAVVVPAASPHRTLADLMTGFRADPARVPFAGGSAGGSDHILAGLIAKSAGMDARRVAYVAFAGAGRRRPPSSAIRWRPASPATRNSPSR